MTPGGTGPASVQRELEVQAMKKTHAAAIGLLLYTAAMAPALTHGGGLNKQGCHNDRRNGGYHCHRGGAAASPRERPSRDLMPSAGNKLTSSGTSNDGRAYRNCSEARAAGAAPVRRGEPGYGPQLDRDNDGIGCEPYRGR